MNCITRVAFDDGRDYITPEDVSAALAANPADSVRLAVLEVIGRRTGFGIEDPGLCAFVAWKGEPTK